MGIVVYFCECPVAWCSTKQPIQALSTMEAEFIGNAEGVKWVLYLCNLLEGVCEIARPTVVEGDNTACKEYASKVGCNTRTKHISVRYHFLKEYTSVLKLFAIKHIPGASNVADLLTKGLPAPRTAALAKFLLGMDLNLSPEGSAKQPATHAEKFS